MGLLLRVHTPSFEWTWLSNYANLSNILLFFLTSRHNQPQGECVEKKLVYNLYTYKIDADADPDPNFHVDADPDRDWNKNDADSHAHPTPSFSHVGKSDFFYF